MMCQRLSLKVSLHRNPRDNLQGNLQASSLVLLDNRADSRRDSLAGNQLVVHQRNLHRSQRLCLQRPQANLRHSQLIQLVFLHLNPHFDRLLSPLCSLPHSLLRSPLCRHHNPHLNPRVRQASPHHGLLVNLVCSLQATPLEYHPMSLLLRHLWPFSERFQVTLF